MSKIKIIAGSFPKQNCAVHGGMFRVRGHGQSYGGTNYGFRDLEDPMVASEANVKKLGGSVGWGIAGGVAFGGLGLLAGLLGGGNKKEVTFVAKLPQGKKIMAVTDHKTWQQILAKHF